MLSPMKISPSSVACLPVLVALVGGCGRFDAESQAHHAYARQLQPLLVENSLLAEHVLGLAADVYNTPKVAPEALAETWSSDLVPLAEHLHSQTSFVAPPPVWQEQHEALVDIWSDRAEAYRSLAESYTHADAVEWKAARLVSDEVKIREEEWFRAANLVLAPQGIILDQFP